MKKREFALWIIFLFIISCTREDLPPEPGSPGGPIGQAVPVGYAEPGDKFLIAPEPPVFSFTSLEQFDNLLLAVGKQDYIYKFGYVWKNKQWNQFKYEGDFVGNSNWIANRAGKTIPVNPLEFQEGENWVVAY